MTIRPAIKAAALIWLCIAVKPALAANFPLAPFDCRLVGAVGGQGDFTFELSRGDGRGQVTLTPQNGSAFPTEKTLIVGTAPSQLAAANGDSTMLTLTILGQRQMSSQPISFWLAETVARSASVEKFELNLTIANKKELGKCSMPKGLENKQ
jgi:hypothetical protein